MKPVCGKGLSLEAVNIDLSGSLDANYKLPSKTSHFVSWERPLLDGILYALSENHGWFLFFFPPWVIFYQSLYHPASCSYCFHAIRSLLVLKFIEIFFLSLSYLFFRVVCQAPFLLLWRLSWLCHSLCCLVTYRNGRSTGKLLETLEFLFTNKAKIIFLENRT